MKRPITNLVIGCLLFLVSQLSAQTVNFSLNPATITANTGDTISLDVVVSNFTNILSFQYGMSWNVSALSFVDVTNLSAQLPGWATSNFGTTNTGNGELKTNWLDPNVAGVSLPNGTVLYTLRLKVLSTTGTTIAFVELPPLTFEFVNGNGMTLNYNLEGCDVNGGGGNSGGGDLTFSAEDLTAPAGTNVCVAVTADNFNNIVSMQYSINFNPAILTYTGVQAFGLPGLNGGSFGTTGASAGNLSFSWDDPSTFGVSVPNGTTLFEICFNVIGTNGQSSNVGFSGSPTFVDIRDGNGNTVPHIFDNGSVTVNGGTPPPIQGFAIIASDETVLPGTSFCVDITVNDFDNIVSMGYTMTFDNNLFHFTGVQGFGLPGLTGGNFGTTMANNGILIFSWDDPGASGVTIPDGQVIYQVCFDVTGPLNCNSSSSFQFTNSPSMIEVYNGNSQLVPWQGINGNLTICNTPQTTLKFIGSQETAGNGSQVCVDVSVENFNCIVSAQYTIHFNQAVLQYNAVQGFGLNGLSGGNFNPQPATGTINFSWDDPTTNGVTLPNGSVIFQICFNVIGTTGQSSPITFDGNPTNVDVVNCNSQTITPAFTNGLVTVGAGCPSPVVIGANPIITHVTCFNGTNGTIDISVSGGNSNYTYKWVDENGTMVGSNQDLTGVGAGAYTVTVTSCSGATMTTGTYNIEQPETPLNVQFQVMNVACFGEMTGGIDLSVTGGTVTGCQGPYTYKWSDGPTTPDRSNLGPGSYIVTVTDCNGCQDIKTINIAGPPSVLTAVATPVNVKCFGQCDGALAITATGGLAPYTYKLNNGQFVNTNTFPNLCAGTYTVQVRDALGCVRTLNATVGTAQAITFTPNTQSASSGCNGSISLAGAGTTGGVAPYSNYSWSNGMTGATIQNLCPGNYCVTVTDANNCTKSACFDVLAPLIASVGTKKNACFGVCDGAINLSIAGGLPNPTFQWSPPAAGQNPTGLCPGTYSVTITSADGQTATVPNIQITQASSPVQINTVLNEGVSLPGQTDGALTVSGTGSFGPPYAYKWSNGPQTATNSFLGEGSYTVTVTDVEGCTNSKTEEIIYDPSAVSLLLTSTNSCESDFNGTLTINVGGGLGPYEVIILGPNSYADTLVSAGGQQVISGLESGAYVVTVNDAAPGAFQQTITKTENVGLTSIVILPIDIYPATNNSSNGKIFIHPVGGGIPYNFQWSNGSFAQNPTNLETGCYFVTIGEASGCYQVFGPLCVENFEASSDNVVPQCSDDTGSITVTPTGSQNTPYHYQWTANGTPVGTDNATLSNVPPGTYSVKITDGLGVSITQVFTLTASSNLDGNVIATSNFNGFNVRCFNGTSGAATANPVNGISSYSFNWSNGATTPSVAGLSAGPITVTITDAIGCTVVATANLTQPNQISVETEAGRNGCTEDGGLATASVFGGIQPYSYLWNDPLKQTSKTATLLEGGEYRLTITDGNGCSMVSETVVPEYVPLKLQALSEPDEGGPSGKAIVQVISGTPPYEYQWQKFPDATDSLITELLPGSYFVAVTDANDCQSLLEVKVTDATQCGEVLPIITPEGDGFNEFFEIACLSRFSENTLEIYNRWGQLVVEYKNYNDGDLWNGLDKRGNPVDDGVYFFVFDYFDPVANQNVTKKGSVTVLRK